MIETMHENHKPEEITTPIAENPFVDPQSIPPPQTEIIEVEVEKKDNQSIMNIIVGMTGVICVS